MKVTIVGSRTLVLEQVAMPLLNELTHLPQEVTILIRCPRNEKIAEFENLLLRLCRAMDIAYSLELPHTRSGRAGVFERDIRMVEQSSAVIAFFDAEHLMQGGTGHVVEKAIDKEIPAFTYVVDEHGAHWAGGVEPSEDDRILAGWNSTSPTTP